MRSLRKILIVATVVVLFCSCGRNALSSWQEQYDLGVRYLSEGKYSEAIIAFTSAISIDNRQALAYEGRGDSWLGMAERTRKNGNADSSALYESARLDYEKTLEFDEPSASVFEKLASVLEIQGNTQQALRILEQGVERTSAPELEKKLEDLRTMPQTVIEEPSETGEEAGSETETGRETGGASSSEAETEPGAVGETGLDTPQAIAASARIFYNPDVYGERWNALISRYQDDNARTRCSINTYGVRFVSPIAMEINGERVEIQEAECVNLSSVFNTEQLYDYQTHRYGNALNTELVVTGIFTRADAAEEINGPTVNESDGYTYYHYNPNGPYVFKILSSNLAGQQ